MAGYRVGIDIGGTFTDLFLSAPETGFSALHKTLTTPDDPSRGALGGLTDLLDREGLQMSDLDEIVHGTTLVTNAVIERHGARVGLLTTTGFRDTLEIGNEQRYDIYDLDLAFPEPLVSRDLRREVAGRIDALGREVTPLDEAGLRAELDALVAEGCDAIAICFVHSYRNPAHELRAAEIVKAAHPELAVSVSSAVVGEISEYPRFVTTCANAFVQPLMAEYLARLERVLAEKGFAGALRLMTSAGGLVPVETARALPIRLLESGPAGGALATAWFARAAGLSDVLSFDMGGTTAKACLIEGGAPHIAPVLEAGREHRFKNGSGLPVRAPTVDMIEIGAGGGSIAAIDAVGLLKVGPRSAGAAPGPACYGRGGLDPTVTDASVLLGYYDPDRFLGGKMALDRPAAEAAMGRIAEPLGLSPVEAAWGIHQTVAESMASAAQIHMVEKGRDPRRYAMIGFGGAGPAFAARVARILGVGEVIIPPASGAASALGFLSAPLAVDLVRSRPMQIDEALSGGIEALAAEMRAEAMAELTAAGVSDTEASFEITLDMRLKGQLHVVAVPLPSGVLDASAEPTLRAGFETVYLDRYSRRPADAPLEVLSLRLRARGPAPRLAVGKAGDTASTAAPATRQVWTGDVWETATIHLRAELAVGQEIAGPAIIEEPESTTLIPKGDRAALDAAGNLRITIGLDAETDVKVTGDLPLAEARARLEADPIALEIMWARLVTVTEDMWQTVCRTAFSLIISESQDFGCALLDPTGETIAHSARVMPVFNITLPRAVRHILKTYPAEQMQEGDVYVTNDPWECAGHLFDIAVVTPVFSEGRVVALAATVGHVADIGGLRSGLAATEVFEEGLQIPPMRLLRGGEENEDIFRLMFHNVREPNQVLGDVRSLVTANARGAAQVRRFLSEYGLRDLRGLAAVLQDRSETAMRAAITALPDGTYRSTVEFNPLGERMTLPMALTVSGDRIEVDFDGAPPQVPRGGINCTLSYTEAHATYPLKCMLTPGVRGNAGCYRAFTVKAPEASILNCTHPAPVSLRTRTGWYASPNIFRAMAETVPGAVRAYSGLPSVLTFWGTDAEGKPYSEMLLMGGGQGAGQGLDGRGALLWPTSAASSSLELLEQRLPIVVQEKGFVTDSGGPGAARGGPATRIRVRRRDAGGEMTCQVAPEGVDLPVSGLHGGAAGLSARATITRGGTVTDCGTGGIFPLATLDDEVELILSAGSGFGPAQERPVSQVERDLRLGLISREAAEATYDLSARKEKAA
ncbi:hydantoinase B/oxoprolinase family protein [Marinibacterium profundimaris]|uniref:Methylhydantoinase n=1 Tax=Marinibacterium profundimaris TaxID=1679460 RepID=A0A225NWJ5_9RHOB|nr:hydantoinase B/oxoprolinase family protein [Marinibacterium profundimaris]OWU77727.1 methylhydantoinase [Marinibacterium profundimaris]